MLMSLVQTAKQAPPPNGYLTKQHIIKKNLLFFFQMEIEFRLNLMLPKGWTEMRGQGSRESRSAVLSAI